MPDQRFFPPYRDLDPDEVTGFRRDGVVHVPEVVDPSSLPDLQALIEHQMQAPSPLAGDSKPGAKRERSFSDRYLWPGNDGFRRFDFESGLAGLAGQAMGSREVRLYFDHIFVKTPGTDLGTPWHQDLPYWPFKGTQICTVWLTLGAVSRDMSALRFIKGSHAWGRWFRPTALSAAIDWADANEAEEIPDFDAEPERYGQLSYDMAPGDALIFSSAIVHGAGPNRSSDTSRMAYATRWLGDDALWDPRPGTDPIVGPDDVDLAPGDLARDDARFPLVWCEGDDA